VAAEAMAGLAGKQEHLGSASPTEDEQSRPAEATASVVVTG
jgi:hypothetical protein